MRLNILVNCVVFLLLVKNETAGQLILSLSDFLENTTMNLMPFLQPWNIIDFIDVLNEINASMPKGRCSDEFQMLTMGILTQERWALKMIDATAKLQSGILVGNIMQVGHYDECVQINEVYQSELIRGKYCTAIFSPHPEFGKDLENWISQNLFTEGNTNKIETDARVTLLKRSFGFCLPRACTAEEIQSVFDKVETVLKSPVHFNFFEQYCDDGDPKPLTSGAICAIIIFTIFGFIALLSTLYDTFFYQKLPEKKPHLCIAFSVYSNSKRLLSLRSTEDSLHCLNGLRVISMLWIVLSHRFMIGFFLPQTNTFEALEEKGNMENILPVAGNMAVDTFFTISGLLVMYVFLKNKEKSTKFSLFGFYIHRILRLTPSLAMMLLFTTTLSIHMGGGPFWSTAIETYQKPCEKYWWQVLLYIQNFFRTDQCLGHTWYLAVDMQLYLLSPLVLFPIIKWPKCTIAGLGVIAALSAVYTFEITLLKNLGSVFYDQTQEQYFYLYAATQSRGITYFIGLICGYFLFKTKNETIVLNSISVVMLWIASLSTMLGIVLSHVFFVDDKHLALESAMFNTFSRPGWSIGLCTIIMLCIYGYGGIINSFLSHPIFVVLIRLNYSVYLLHSLIGVLVAGQQREPIYFKKLTGFHQVWGDFMFTLGISVIWTLMFESPIIILEKIIFSKDLPKKVEEHISGEPKPKSEMTNGLNNEEKKNGELYQINIS